MNVDVAPDKPIKIVIDSATAHLPVVRAAVGKMSELLGFDEDACLRIMLSTDEALTNVVRHAYDGKPGNPIEIEIAPLSQGEQRGIRIALRDYGHAVDPKHIRSRDLADVRPGGLGVHIMCECMDDLEYRPAEGGGTILTMTKALTKPECERRQ